MTTDRPINLSVGVCPKDISTHKLNKEVAVYESIWMGGSPDWTTLQIHLGMYSSVNFYTVNPLLSHSSSLFD